MVLSSSAGYKLWAPLYDQGPNPLLALEQRITRDLIPELGGRTVIDVGCGTGRSMLRYGERGALTFGVDSSPEMLNEARRKPGLSARVVLAEASRLPFADDSADLTVCSFALSYFPDAHQSLSEIARITKRSGRIVVSDLHPMAAASGWNRSFRAGNHTYEIAYQRRSEGELQSACATAGLQIVTQQDASFSDPERPMFTVAGKEHLYSKVTGTPAVRVIVCRKI
ncbi:MAG: class I SAM-dependent methyltransferase [Bryobacteraceae bacterium]